MIRRIKGEQYRLLMSRAVHWEKIRNSHLNDHFLLFIYSPVTNRLEYCMRSSIQATTDLVHPGSLIFAFTAAILKTSVSKRKRSYALPNSMTSPVNPLPNADSNNAITLHNAGTRIPRCRYTYFEMSTRTPKERQ